MPNLVFIEKNGNRNEVEVPVGYSVMEAAQMYGIDIEGACEGVMSCSTCHVIVESNWYINLPPASEDEQYMLNLTMDLTNFSRLGCQIIMTCELDGLVVRLPREARNIML